MDAARLRRDLRLLPTYAQAAWTHKRALGIPPALVAAAEWAHAHWWQDYTLLPWVRPTAWVLAVLPAQYLAWRDAFESRGTPEKPFLSPGLTLGEQQFTPGWYRSGSLQPSRLSVEIKGQLSRHGVLIAFDADVYGYEVTALVPTGDPRRLPLEHDLQLSDEIMRVSSKAFKVSLARMDPLLSVDRLRVTVHSDGHPNLIRAEFDPPVRAPRWWDRWRHRPPTAKSKWSVLDDQGPGGAP